MIEYKTLSVREFRRESAGILQEHYEELTRNKEIAELLPDWENYERLEQSNRLFTLTVWQDGEMVGYSVFIVGTHLHYKKMGCAFNDVLFLRPSHRQGFTGVKLIRESEKALLKLGVKKIFWRIKYGTTLEKILPRLGYENEEFTVAKVLGD
jgi:hypothetical protein